MLSFVVTFNILILEPPPVQIILKSLFDKANSVPLLSVTLTKPFVTHSTLLIPTVCCGWSSSKLSSVLPEPPEFEPPPEPSEPPEFEPPPEPPEPELPPFIVSPPAFVCDTVSETVTFVPAVSTLTFSACTVTSFTTPTPFIMVFFAFCKTVTFWTLPSTFKFVCADNTIVCTFPLVVTSVGEDTWTVSKSPSNIQDVVTVVFATLPPCVNILTGADFFCTETLLILQFFNVTVWIPPPFTINAPFTVTFSNVMSPSPTPSDNIKSLSITVFCNVTSGVLIITFLPLLDTSVALSVTTFSTEVFNNVATSAREINSSGWNAPSSDVMYPYCFIAAT